MTDPNAMDAIPCDWCGELEEGRKYFIAPHMDAAICWDCLSQLHYVMTEIKRGDGQPKQVH